MNENIVYREIDNQSLEEMAALFSDTFREEPWKEEWSLESARERLLGVMEARYFYGIGAWKKGELYGFLIGWLDFHCGETVFEMRELAVKQTGRGQGIGSGLYREMEKRMKEKGVEKLALLTLNAALTRRFYEKHGFQKSGDLIIMEKYI